MNYRKDNEIQCQCHKGLSTRGEGIGIIKQYIDKLKIKHRYKHFAFKFRVKIYLLLLRILYQMTFC